MVRFHFGSISQSCSSQDMTDMESNKLPAQLKSDALFPIDTKALIPKCLAKSSNGEDLVIYEQGENIWLWVSLGLVLLIFLIILVSAFKGGNRSSVVLPSFAV